MEQYRVCQPLGEGLFGGLLTLVEDRPTGEKRIRKQIKLRPRRYGFPTCTSIREIQILAALSQHSNLVRMYDMHYIPQEEKYYLILEYTEYGTLQNIMDTTVRSSSSGNSGDGTQTQSPSPLTKSAIRFILRGALEGLRFLHSHGCIHRNIQPSSLFITATGDCKVGEFGLARRSHSLTPLSSYVSLRWYRAPELLLESLSYGTPVDMFALACVAAEMLHPHGKILFPGTSHVDQLYMVLQAVGFPTIVTWPAGVDLLQRRHLKVQSNDASQNSQPNLLAVLPSGLDTVTLDWLQMCLLLNPTHRATADMALQHDFLTDDIPNTPNDDDTLVAPEMYQHHPSHTAQHPARSIPCREKG